MITADVVVDERGGLVSCRVEGHAGSGPKGNDAACAAVSVLARTALRTLSRGEGVFARGDAPERGALLIEADCGPGGEAFLGAVTAFLVEGLESVATEFSDYCSVRVRTQRRKDHGS